MARPHRLVVHLRAGLPLPLAGAAVPAGLNRGFPPAAAALTDAGRALDELRGRYRDQVRAFHFFSGLSGQEG